MQQLIEFVSSGYIDVRRQFTCPDGTMKAYVILY